MFVKNKLKLLSLLIFLLLAACSSLSVEHDEFSQRFRVYQCFGKHAELKGVFDYKTGITRIVLYTQFRNHSIVDQNPLLLSDGTRIEGKTSYKRSYSYFYGHWINYSCFNLSKSLLEKMIKEEESSSINDKVNIKVGFQDMALSKSKIMDFLVMLESIENKDYSHIDNNNHINNKIK